MKKTYLFLTLLVGASVVGCRNRQQNAGEQVGDGAAVSQDVARNELTMKDTLRLNSGNYVIELHRVEDASLPKVKDDQDADVLDNRVDIVITRNGADFFKQSFTKSDFAAGLSDTDKKACILSGMAFDKENSTEEALRFGAKVGTPFYDDGPAFTVKIATGSGQVSIEKNVNPEIMQEEGSAEEQSE